MRLFIYEHVTAQPAHTFPASLRAEGRAMLDAIVADFAAVPDLEVQTLRAPRDEEREFRELARRADHTLIIAPEFGQRLLTRCRWVEEAGGRLLGPSSEAVALTADKLLLARHLAAHGIRTPRSAPLTDSAPPFAFPIVCKPRFGAGSQNISLSRDAPPSASRLDEEMIVQPFIPGLAASVAFLVGVRQQLALAPAAQHLSHDNRFRYLGGRLPLRPHLAERAVNVARPAIQTVRGLRAYVGVDVVLGAAVDGSDDSVIEINPRLTTSYLGLRRLAETNLAEAMLRIVMGEQVAPITWRGGVVRFRADGALV
jgi:predicted ATP-grasp superfamily ATP-dependent carboligase